MPRTKTKAFSSALLAAASTLVLGQAAFAATEQSAGNNVVDRGEVAGSQSFHFDIPSQSLADALEHFRSVTNLQYFFADGRVRDMTVAGLSGNFTPGEALMRILADTPYRARFSDDNTVVIYLPSNTASSGVRESRLASRSVAMAQTQQGAQQGVQESTASSDQEAAQASRPMLLEEIIVTARQVQESLQRTPVSVSAFTSSMIVKSDLPTLADVANLAPNVQFSFAGTASGSASSANVYIRGIGQNDFLPTQDPGVGIYIDGVYLGRTLGSVLETSDVAQVEVLRGPQGTLFGRNNIGGAISLKTREPGHEFGGQIRAIVGGRVSSGGDVAQDRLAAVCGAFDCAPDVLRAAQSGSIPGSGSRYEVHGRLDMPVNDDLTTGFNFLYRRRGAVTTRLDGTRLGIDNIWGARLKAVWTPTASTKITLSGDFAFENENSIPDITIDAPVESGFFRAFNNNALVPIGGPQGATDPACAGTDPLGGPVPNPACANNTFTLGNFLSAEGSPSRNDTNSFGFNLTAEFDVTDRLSVKSISAYRAIDAKFNRAPDGTPFELLFTQQDFEQDQYSQEFQFFVDFFDNRLQTVSGVFLMFEKGSNHSENAFFPQSPPNRFGGEVDNFDVATFSEITFDVTDRWRLLAGGRFTHDHKEATAESVRTAEASFRGPMNFLSGEALERQSINFDKLTWRFGTQYDVTDDSMVYATVSRGFKSGGFNTRLTQPTSVVPSFDPEFVTAWELGMKNELRDIGLRFNWNLFWMRYTNIQVSGNVPPEINTVTFNGGDGRIKGIEAELQYSPTADLSIRGSFGFQDAQFTEISPGAVVSKEDEFVRTPKFTINSTITYDFYLGEYGTLTPSVDWDYKSAIEFEPVNSLARDPGRNIVDLAITHSAPWFGGYDLTFGVNNVGDKTFYVTGDSNRTCCFDARSPGRKRNWFLTLIKEF